MAAISSADESPLTFTLTAEQATDFQTEVMVRLNLANKNSAIFSKAPASIVEKLGLRTKENDPRQTILSLIARNKGGVDRTLSAVDLLTSLKANKEGSASSDMALIWDAKAPYTTSFGPNIVCGEYINLFGNKKGPRAILNELMKFRSANELNILKAVAKHMACAVEEHADDPANKKTSFDTKSQDWITNYGLAAKYLQAVVSKCKQDHLSLAEVGLKLRSRCQTWRDGKGTFGPQFSVASFHSQTEVCPTGPSPDNVKGRAAFVAIHESLPSRMEQYAAGGGTFLDLDQLHSAFSHDGAFQNM